MCLQVHWLFLSLTFDIIFSFFLLRFSIFSSKNIFFYTLEHVIIVLKSLSTSQDESPLIAVSLPIFLFLGDIVIDML